MQEIKDIIPELDLKLTQDDMNKILHGMIYEAKTAEDKSFFQNQLNGGNCFFCGTEFKQVHIKTSLTDYYKFDPQCKCYEEREKERERKEMSKRICLFSGVPKEYIGKSFSELDLNNILSETVKSIEKIKRYIDSGLYKKGVGVLLYGDVGTGKTLLATLAFTHLLIKADKTGKFISMSDILRDIINSNYEFVEVLMRYDVILFDDLDKLKAAKNNKTGWASERIFSLFDKLVNNGKIIIATTNVKELSGLNDFFDSSVVSRIIGNCEVIKIEGKDYRMIKRGILRENAGL